MSVFGSMRLTVPARGLKTQTEPSPAATAGAVPDLDQLSDDFPDSRIDANYRVADHGRDPDRALACGEADRLRADRDRLADGLRGRRIDSGDRVVLRR